MVWVTETKFATPNVGLPTEQLNWEIYVVGYGNRVAVVSEDGSF